MDFEENKQQQPIPPNHEADDMDESFEAMLDASFAAFEPPRRGEIRQATILQVEPNEIIVDMGAKQDGIVTGQDLERLDDSYRSSLHVGQTVPVYVLTPRDSDGNLIVSINMGLQQNDWDEARRLMEQDEVVEVSVTGHNRGGILVRWNRLEGFIPSSHMVTVSAGLQGNERRETLNSLVGQRVGVKVIEVDQDRRRLIFSEREAQREWRAQQKARLLSELHEGDEVTGTVTGLRDFGAFVNLGGADGLIHVSELAWHRVDHPRDVLRVGQEIEVYVLSLDRETNRIALSRKRLLRDPWDDALQKYHEGMQVEGTVTNVVDFGAFIALDDGLEGLLHLSEMGDGSLKEPHSYVKKGDRLQLRISRLEPEQRRVGFTQRWGTDQPIIDRQEQEAAEIDQLAAAADELDSFAPADDTDTPDELDSFAPADDIDMPGELPLEMDEPERVQTEAEAIDLEPLEMDEPERVQTEAEAIDLEPLETDELDREQPEAGPVDFEPFEMDEPDRSESIVPDEDENSRA